MSLQGIVHIAQQTMQRFLNPGDIAIDATVGAGYDASFLARSVGPTGHVYGFDVQKEALDRATGNLSNAGLMDRVTLFNAGHETMADHLPPEIHGTVKAVSFNLGYLPASESPVTTLVDTSLAAIKTAMALLHRRGVISIAIYGGHPQGQVEQHRLKAWAAHVPYDEFRIASYEFTNKARNQETLLLMERAKPKG
ncbi:tRNA (mnm(5)s(2)U34)-methyltransferase [Desulfoluna spongiiphila]|uniref:Putative rRNA methylase n=1 Tax=Desulfoluna spongiiphila TaxID=419481 RepID=A0A1G5J3D4_9BACT|nr:class I SAM-dependent methyltransferase [Desulfoluna spongiiphila]SCY82767.1 Putative rRNA methylase [Desulfoluna spongiiphila]VVS94449.1 s-adenosyl-l-methionine-dependent methyltransferase [Desulfoluna spongiiphila]